jgi:hypothetical protein
MPDDRLPFLRGRISAVDSYESPQRGFGAIRLPSLDPAAHSTRLLQQLDAIEKIVQSRRVDARDGEASREIVTVSPVSGSDLAPDQLDHPKSDARLIGVNPDTGSVLLDIAVARLDHLRRKVDAFGDDSRVTTRHLKDGSVSLRRDGERAIAPIESIALASLADVRGPRLRATALDDGRAYWFEVGCRGGYRRPKAETEASRGQITRQLQRIGWTAKIDEFLGPETAYFFVRLTLAQVEDLRASTDCVYEIELAPPALRDLWVLEDTTTNDLDDFRLTPPDDDAPAIVLLDSGIATQHPLLRAAILTATTAGEEIPSPEDTYGHGTKMAGVSLYDDLGASVEDGRAEAQSWLQSSRLLVTPGLGTASLDNYEKWPVLTQGAVRSAEDANPRPRRRVFALAVTRTMQDPPFAGYTPTLWSQAVDQIAHNDGEGRVLIVSAGNARYDQWLALAEQHPQLQLSEKIHQPAQAANAITVGACTNRTTVPLAKDYAEAIVVATEAGGISPFTSTGLSGNEWPVKPDVMMEGGNLAILGVLPDANVPTLTALTTSNKHNMGQPLGQISMTSEATARAARLAARVWAVEPDLRPETIRGLLVHSASWTPVMLRQFQNLNDRLLACGYGLPDERLACECARDLATVIVEDSMPNAVIEEEPKKNPPKRPTTKKTEPKVRRKAKLYRLPIPESLLDQADSEVELRVTLSYFAEPNKFGRRTFRGLDLKWDMQGPHETADQFIERVNALKRSRSVDGKRKQPVRTESFNWDVGIQTRSRGTVQSDRWRGKMSALAGDKLIAIVPILGWWDQRRPLREQAMNFSLIATVSGPGVYAVIKPHVEAQIQAVVEIQTN